MKIHLFKKTKKPEQTYEPYCPKCEYFYSTDGAEFNYCPDCGTELILEKICEICSNPIAGNHEFCSKCGNKVIRMEVKNGNQKAQSKQQPN